MNVKLLLIKSLGFEIKINVEVKTVEFESEFRLPKKGIRTVFNFL